MQKSSSGGNAGLRKGAAGGQILRAAVVWDVIRDAGASDDDRSNRFFGIYAAFSAAARIRSTFRGAGGAAVCLVSAAHVVKPGDQPALFGMGEAELDLLC